MSEDVKMYKRRVVKNGKRYMDLVLVWTYGDKVYEVRFNPTFARDWSKCISQAQEFPES